MSLITLNNGFGIFYYTWKFNILLNKHLLITNVYQKLVSSKIKHLVQQLHSHRPLNPADFRR